MVLIWKGKGKREDWSQHLLGGPLESRDHTVLDLIEVLHSLGAIHQQVGACALGTEAPDLTGLSGIPVELLHQVATTLLQVLTGCDVTLKKGKGKGLVISKSIGESSIWTSKIVTVKTTTMYTIRPVCPLQVFGVLQLAKKCHLRPKSVICGEHRSSIIQPHWHNKNLDNCVHDTTCTQQKQIQ